VKLTVKGRPGHGSVPHGDNCAEHLVAALEQVRLWSQQVRVTPLMRSHIKAMAEAGFLHSGDEKAAIRLAERSPALRAPARQHRL
jgi:acetylornithine deacetylase/succinyl-diaminopimelate desuccinylase-like protein